LNKPVYELLDVGIKTLYKLLKDGEIKSLKTGRENRIPTQLQVRGNSKKADAMLQSARLEYTQEIKKTVAETGKGRADMLFSDTVAMWIVLEECKVRNTTYATYYPRCKNDVIPFFEAIGCTLGEIEVGRYRMFLYSFAIRAEFKRPGNQALSFFA